VVAAVFEGKREVRTRWKDILCKGGSVCHCMPWRQSISNVREGKINIV